MEEINKTGDVANTGNPVGAPNVSNLPLLTEPKKKFPFDKNKALWGVAALAVIGMIAVIIVTLNPGNVLSYLKINLPSSSDKAAKGAVDYINSNLLKDGKTATLTGSSEESGVIKISISIDGQSFDSYITKDGKLLFPDVVKISQN